VIDETVKDSVLLLFQAVVRFFGLHVADNS